MHQDKKITKKPKVRAALNTDYYEKVFCQGQDVFGMGNKSGLTENKIVGDQEFNAQVYAIWFIKEDQRFCVLLEITPL